MKTQANAEIIKLEAQSDSETSVDLKANIDIESHEFGWHPFVEPMALAVTHPKSGDIAKDIYAVTAPLDGVLTIPRVISVAEASIYGETGSGWLIPYLSHHAWISGCLLGVTSIPAFLALWLELRNQAIIKKNNDIGYVSEELFKLIKLKKNSDTKDIIDCANKYLLDALQQSGDLNNIYENISIKDGKIVYRYKNKSINVDESSKFYLSQFLLSIVNRSSSIVSSFWDALSLSSMAYWVLWMGVLLFTATFGIGIVGCPPILAFGLPLMAGAAYIGIKMYNFSKSKPKEQKDLKQDILKLMRLAMLRIYYDADLSSPKSSSPDVTSETLSSSGSDEVEEEKKLISVPVSKDNLIDRKLQRFTRNKSLSVAMTGLSVFVTTFVIAQFNAWLVMAILASAIGLTIPGVNIVWGSLLIVISAVTAGYAMYRRTQQLNDDLKQLQPHITNGLIDEMKVNYSQLNNLDVQNNNLPQFNRHQFFSDVTRTAPSKYSMHKKIFSRGFKFFMGIETGILIFRILCIPGQAMLIPFAAIGLPHVAGVAIALLLIVGVVYGAMKVYEYHKNKEEERDRLFFKQLPERGECLKLQLQHAQMSFAS